MQLIYGHKSNRYKKLILIWEPIQINFSNLILKNTTSQPKIKFPKIYFSKKYAENLEKIKILKKHKADMSKQCAYPTRGSASNARPGVQRRHARALRSTHVRRSARPAVRLSTPLLPFFFYFFETFRFFSTFPRINYILYIPKFKKNSQAQN